MVGQAALHAAVGREQRTSAISSWSSSNSTSCEEEVKEQKTTQDGEGRARRESDHTNRF